MGVRGSMFCSSDTASLSSVSSSTNTMMSSSSEDDLDTVTYSEPSFTIEQSATIPEDSLGNTLSLMWSLWPPTEAEITHSSPTSSSLFPFSSSSDQKTLSARDDSESVECSVVSSSSDDDIMLDQLSQEVSEGDLGGVTEEHQDMGVQGG